MLQPINTPKNFNLLKFVLSCSFFLQSEVNVKNENKQKPQTKLAAKLNCCILEKAITLLKYAIYTGTLEFKYCDSKWPQLCNPLSRQDMYRICSASQNYYWGMIQCQAVLTNLELNWCGYQMFALMSGFIHLYVYEIHLCFICCNNLLL